MHYHYLTLEDQFNQKYQALVDYLKMHENTPIPDMTMTNIVYDN